LNYVLSKQLLRSGASIGANIEEASAAQSRKDFINKMAISSKEARETKYWLRLIQESRIVNCDIEMYIKEIDEIIKILTSIVKTSKERQQKIYNSKFKIQHSKLTRLCRVGLS
jgi:four helix bundle protein